MRAKIYNASAGSGKTYQLAYKYVHDAIEDTRLYRHILAVTFTNKATEEMKSRILKEIHTLASGLESSYTADLIRDLKISEREIRRRALELRAKILHDYSHFTVLTIDTFFQRILRSFIKELDIDLNYNIEIETSTVLAKSTDALIEKVTQDEELRKWLIRFVQERVEDGAGWDVRTAILGLGGEIFSENIQLRNGTEGLRKQLAEVVGRMTSEGEKTRSEMIAAAKDALQIMARAQVSTSDFKGKSRSFAKYFDKVAAGNIASPSKTATDMSLTTEGWAPKGSDAQALAAVLQPLLKQMCDLYTDNHKLWNTMGLVKENYRSFALLADLYNEVTTMCKEQNLMLLSETKEILAKFIGENDVPFIYEKVGNRFDRFMIDEFQDTSRKEWHNFLPLLQNAMAQSEDTSVFVVGDIKQSIYRWRGGDWELLHTEAQRDLGEDDTEVINMRNNFRSLPAVVEFNNNIMARVVRGDNAELNTTFNAAREEGVLTLKDTEAWHDMLKNAYTHHAQNAMKRSENQGYVALETYEEEPPVMERICQLLDRGYRPCDILILVRRATDGAQVAEKLLEFKRTNTDPRYRFDVMTQEALIIGSAPVSGFIMAAFALTMNPNDKLQRAIYNHYLGRKFDAALSDQERDFFLSLSILSPEEAFEKIVMHHDLNHDSRETAYLQAIHEQIISFTARKVADIPLFVSWWQEQGAKKSLSIEQSTTTIEITTIHKAKGLEKPAVIIPYCKWMLKPKIGSIVWAKGEGKTAEMGRFPVDFKEAMKDSDFAREYYRELLYTHIDNINLLYVALTRASESLHLFVPRKGDNHVGSLMLKHIEMELQPDEVSEPDPRQGETMRPITPSWATLRRTEMPSGDTRYELGEFTPHLPSKNGASATEHVALEHYRTSEAQLALSLPSERYTEDIDGVHSPREFGIMMHKAFQEASTREDIFTAIDQMRLNGLISKEEGERLRGRIEETLRDERVADWFEGDWEEIRTESDIILPEGSTRRPDRVMIREGHAVVIDYKFGKEPTDANGRQMKEYLNLLRRMGYTDCAGYLWYVMRGEILKIEE